MSPRSLWEAAMALLNFKKRDAGATAPAPVNPQVEAFLQGYSIEVMPRTAEKVENFRDLLPEGTRVYIAHIEGTPIEEMVATAKRLSREGYPVMPHFPARIIKDRATLADWIARYQGEAGVDQALLLAGGVEKPHGDFHASTQLLETGEFDRAGFKRLHVAGHPEGNRDIDPDGSRRNVDEALRWKQRFSEQTDAEMAIATQFAFDAKPIIAWADALREAGGPLPHHIRLAGAEKRCFHCSAASTFLRLPSGSMSLLPSGWPAMCRRLKPALSKRPVSRSWVEASKSPWGVSTPPASTSACSTFASP